MVVIVLLCFVAWIPTPPRSVLINKMKSENYFKNLFILATSSLLELHFKKQKTMHLYSCIVVFTCKPTRYILLHPLGQVFLISTYKNSNFVKPRISKIQSPADGPQQNMILILIFTFYIFDFQKHPCCAAWLLFGSRVSPCLHWFRMGESSFC